LIDPKIYMSGCLYVGCLEFGEVLDIDHPGDGTAHLNLHGGGDKRAHGAGIGGKDIHILLTRLTGFPDQVQHLFDVLVVRPDQECHVALAEEPPR